MCSPPQVKRDLIGITDVQRSATTLGIGAALRSALPIWIASRFSVALLGLAAAWTTARNASTVPGFLDQWNRWDVGLFIKVARDGYLPPGPPEHTEVDFPGLPLALRATHLVVPNWVAAGLLVAFIAGAFSCAALFRLAADETRDGGQRAVLALVLFPYAVFLFAGYSEGLFLAFTTTSWLAARRQRWALAGLLAAGATATRLIGIAFCVALWVQYFTTAERRRSRNLAWLLLPLVPPLTFQAYLWGRTGHWDSFSRAQQAGWGRAVAWPWEGFRTTLDAAIHTTQGPGYRWFWMAEIVAVVIGLALLIGLLVERRWAEATYVGATVLLTSASSYWDSGVRAALIWFPLYLWIARRPRMIVPYAWLAAPLMAVFVVT
ncbi:MAG: hypothetical protein ACXVA7_22610, partial [Isosphaeraceae bacterium]